MLSVDKTPPSKSNNNLKKTSLETIEDLVSEENNHVSTDSKRAIESKRESNESSVQKKPDD